MDKNEVIKHSAVIQVEHKTSLLGQQLFNVLLANAFHELKTKRSHTITVQEILKYIPSAKNVAHLREVLRSMCTPVEYNIMGKDKKNIWGFFALLPEANIPEGDSVCTYSFTDTMVNLMSDPSVYAKISLLIQQQYRGGRYGWALYELCFDYKEVKKTPKLSISELKKFFGLEEKTYPQYKDLNKRVLKPAIHEVNKQTDLTITLETYRTKRRITHIQFFIAKKKAFQSVLPLPSKLAPEEEHEKAPENRQDIFKRLKILGIGDDYIKQALEELSYESVEMATEALEELEREKGLNYPNHAFKASLKNAWKSKKRRRIETRKEDIRKQKEKLEEIEAHKNIEKELEERRRKEENAKFAALSDDEKFDLLLPEIFQTRLEYLDEQAKQDFHKIVYEKILVEYPDNYHKASSEARNALTKVDEEHEAREEAKNF